MFLKFSGKKVWYSDAGKGIPVVLLHGYLESSEVWNGFAEKLSEKYRIIKMDLPGHGRSEVYAESHTMEFMAAAVKELLDSLAVKKAILTGHSLGGYVTLAFVEMFPEYLTGYCLFHSQPFSDSHEALEKRKREIAIVNAGKKELMYPDNVTRMFAPQNLEKFSDALQRSKNIASQIPGEGIIAALNGMMERPSRLSVMEGGGVPCLWILGTMDSYIPCEAIRSKVQLPSNASVVILTQSGHLGFVEEEDLSVRVVSDFVRRVG